MPALVVECLDKAVHNRRDFDCGDQGLNDYLARTARQHVDKGYALVWVAVSEHGSARVMGYYTLSMSSLAPDDLPRPAGVKKVPVVLLGRLAVDKRYQGRNIGTRLLAHAIDSALSLSTQVGLHAMVVDALNEQAAAFYQQYGFEKLTTGPLHLYRTIEDIAGLGMIRESGS